MSERQIEEASATNLRLRRWFFWLLKNCGHCAIFRNNDENLEDTYLRPPDAQKNNIARSFCGTEVVFFVARRAPLWTVDFGGIFWNEGGIFGAMVETVAFSDDFSPDGRAFSYRTVSRTISLRTVAISLTGPFLSQNGWFFLIYF